MLTLIAFVVALGVLIAVHEYGRSEERRVGKECVP